MKKLTLADVKEIRRLTKKSEKGYLNFIEELEIVLKSPQPGEWFKKPLDGVVVDEIWEQSIGTIKYRSKVHTFALMYVPNQGLAVKQHGHNCLVHNAKDIKKTKELYVFYVPGKQVQMRFCGKDDTHELKNDYGCPIYVVSAKVTGRG